MLNVEDRVIPDNPGDPAGPGEPAGPGGPGMPTEEEPAKKKK